jgi:hypothetical protein
MLFKLIIIFLAEAYFKIFHALLLSEFVLDHALQEDEDTKLNTTEKILETLHAMTLEEFVAAVRSLLTGSNDLKVISFCVAN